MAQTRIQQDEERPLISFETRRPARDPIRRTCLPSVSLVSLVTGSSGDREPCRGDWQGVEGDGCLLACLLGWRLSEVAWH